MSDDMQKAKTLERATQQLDIIEQLITLLVDDINIEELKTSERLNLALKLMTQHARALKLYDDISGDDGPSSGQQAFISKLMRFMRNEPSEQGPDNPLLWEEDGGSFFFGDGA